MKLSDYQWSRNPRGMHNQGAMDLNVLKAQKMGWAKIVGLGDEYVNFAAECLANNITPIIRIYRREHSGVPIDAEMMGQFRRYLDVGVKWFEIYNEPNLFIEWPPGRNYDPRNTAEVIAPICDNWINWAEQIIDAGGYAGFIPLADAGGGWENTPTWINQLLLYMYDKHYNRFLRILDNGYWQPTHPYIYNHFYQEMPNGGVLSMRPPELQNYAEGGWHFEYPYDPISQASDPGRTVWGGTPLAPEGDVIGLTSCGQAWLERLQELFGVGAVPILGTEGGLWPEPKPGIEQRLDPRFQGFSWESHGHVTTAMFDWISRQGPPWMFGVALWKWDIYYSRADGLSLPTATLLDNTTPFTKDVPPIDTLGEYRLRDEGQALPPVDVVVEPPGPGPVHGQPTYHFLILAPGIDEDWFFQIAQVYYERFQPTLMTIPEFINFLPKAISLAVTVISTPDLVDFMNDQIARRWKDVYFDLVVANNARELEELLNSRVAVGRRFG